jgi:hypothetical protein
MKLFGVLGVSVTFMVVASGSSGDEAANTCRVAGAETLASNQHARLMAIPYSRHSTERYIGGCAYSQNEIVSLDNPRSARYAFSRPAMHLRGAVMAGAVNDCSDVESSCETLIQLTDLAAVQTELVVNARPPRGPDLVKVGSLRLTANGGVAWITCPDGPADDGYAEALRGPSCTRPGFRDSVLAVRRDERPARGRTFAVTVLAHSSTIDPSSLRVRGNVVSWRQGDRRRHVYLSRHS